MLTGRLPYEGDSPVAVAIQTSAPSPCPPREIIPDIPLGLEAITMKAMASRIDQRYMNAEAMLRDLEEFRKNPQVEFSLQSGQLPRQPAHARRAHPAGGQRQLPEPPPASARPAPPGPAPPAVSPRRSRRTTKTTETASAAW